MPGCRVRAAEEVGLDRARGDDVDGDAAAAQFLRHVERQDLDRSLGGE